MMGKTFRNSKNHKIEVLESLKKNEDDFISGEMISADLGISRTYVWKVISKLKEDGYSIEAVPNKGYRLTGKPDKMYVHEIKSGLKTRRLGGGGIYYFDEITSTNDYAYKLAESGEEEGSVVIAEAQTRGKGRQGRKWISPSSGGLYFSIVLRPHARIEQLSLLTLIAAISVLKAIKEMTGISSKVKWPNDLLCDGKKICGILIEMKAQPDNVDFLVLGIGLNVNTSRENLPDTADSLSEITGNKIDRVKLLRCMLLNIEKDYLKFLVGDLDHIHREIKRFSCVVGKRIEVFSHERKISGIACDIDELGALIIREDDGREQRVFSGDVRLADRISDS